MNIIKQKLQGTQYQKLKEVFTELGIPQVWKSGTKKVVMIEAALELLSELHKEENLVVEEVIEKMEVEKEIAEEVENEKERSEFDKAVSKIIDQKELWTKESMDKRIKVYANIFNQHRNMPKGNEALAKQEILKAAFKLIF